MSPKEMRSTQLIQREDGRFVGSANEGEVAASDLGKDKILFKDSETIVAHRVDAEILCDAVETFTRDEVVNLVEGGARAAP